MVPELRELVKIHASDSKDNEEPLSHDEVLIVKVTILTLSFPYTGAIICHRFLLFAYLFTHYRTFILCPTFTLTSHPHTLPTHTLTLTSHPHTHPHILTLNHDFSLCVLTCLYVGIYTITILSLVCHSHAPHTSHPSPNILTLTPSHPPPNTLTPSHLHPECTGDERQDSD